MGGREETEVPRAAARAMPSVPQPCFALAELTRSSPEQRLQFERVAGGRFRGRSRGTSSDGGLLPPSPSDSANDALLKIPRYQTPLLPPPPDSPIHLRPPLRQHLVRRPSYHDQVPRSPSPSLRPRSSHRPGPSQTHRTPLSPLLSTQAHLAPRSLELPSTSP